MITKHKDKNGKVSFRIMVSFTLTSGKRIQKRFRADDEGRLFLSHKQAEKFKILKTEELRAQYEKHFNQLSFSSWHEEYLRKAKETKRRSTYYQYDGDLKKWLTSSFISLKLGEIKRGHIHDLVFVEMVKKGATDKTRKRFLKSLNAVLNSAVDHGHISLNPSKGLLVKTPPSKKLILNTEQAQTFLTEAKICRHPFYPIWAFALLTGMRSGELYGLRWQDIDESSGIIQISHQWTNKDGYHSTKSNKCRVIPISNDLGILLKELRNNGPYSESLKGLSDNPIFINDLVLPRVPEWRYGDQSKVTREFLERIGLSPVKFHDLRATFITNLLANGVPLAQVMSVVGHSKTSTTDEYLRLAGVNIAGSTEKLGYSLKKEDGNILQLVK